ncbi:hypothetical protein ACIQ9R_37630 [Streptomyces sp. NPDC094447]|uniref:hypothetical protein n=1 Tax=Streptomyces sp. NPDC094447 TaxID=3366062 RepID=UPI0037FC1AC1
MDDDKTIDEPTYTVTIAGEDYQFQQPDPELIERMILISHMNADHLVTLEACTKWFSVAAGPETWAVIMRRFLAGDIKAQDLIDGIKTLNKSMKLAKELASDA